MGIDDLVIEHLVQPGDHANIFHGIADEFRRFVQLAEVFGGIHFSLPGKRGRHFINECISQRSEPRVDS